MASAPRPASGRRSRTGLVSLPHRVEIHGVAPGCEGVIRGFGAGPSASDCSTTRLYAATERASLIRSARPGGSAHRTDRSRVSRASCIRARIGQGVHRPPDGNRQPDRSCPVRHTRRPGRHREGQEPRRPQPGFPSVLGQRLHHAGHQQVGRGHRKPQPLQPFGRRHQWLASSHPHRPVVVASAPSRSICMLASDSPRATMRASSGDRTLQHFNSPGMLTVGTQTLSKSGTCQCHRAILAQSCERFEGLGETEQRIVVTAGSRESRSQHLTHAGFRNGSSSQSRRSSNDSRTPRRNDHPRPEVQRVHSVPGAARPR